MQFEEKWYGMVVNRLEEKARAFSRTLEGAWEDDGDIVFRRSTLEEFECWVGVLDDIDSVDARHRGHVREALEGCMRSLGDLKDDELARGANHAIRRTLKFYTD